MVLHENNINFNLSLRRTIFFALRHNILPICVFFGFNYALSQIENNLELKCESVESKRNGLRTVSTLCILRT